MLETAFARRYVLPVAAALIPIALLVMVAYLVRPDVRVAGVTDGGAIQPAVLGQVEITTNGDADRVQVLLDGAAVPTRWEGERIHLDVPEPAEGEHTLEVRSPNTASVLPGRTTELTFTVDGTPPALAVPPVPATELDMAATVHGTVHEESTVLAQGELVEVADDGSFSVPVPAGTPMVTLEARDEAGNVTTEDVSIPVRHPGMRAVHMTAHAWASKALREPIMEMAREGRIDTVQLDIKDESGQIGYLSEVPLANEIGAAKDYYDVRAALDELHAAGLRVVGRIVVFRDPVHGEAAWSSGNTDWLVQNTSGTPWTGGYGEYAFTNFANPEVRAYNLDIAREAAALGFDEILYDYIRRPDGHIDQMQFPGLTTTPEESIASFLAESRPLVREHGALLGVSVFGIAATRPTQIAQDIPAMSKYVDYVSPMTYPSHWGSGEYGVANPEAQPYDITARSLADFVTLANESSTTVIPWLQDFSLRIPYGPEEVRAQIEAAEANGIDSFILWNAACRYHAEALDPVPRE
jgi:hypothetical protein